MDLVSVLLLILFLGRSWAGGWLVGWLAGLLAGIALGAEYLWGYNGGFASRSLLGHGDSAVLGPCFRLLINRGRSTRDG